jgi:hypothetical protein
MNFAWWPPNLTNVTLYSSKTTIIQKYNTHVEILLSQMIFLPCAQQVKIICYSLLKLQVNVPIHAKQKKYLLNYKKLNRT